MKFLVDESIQSEGRDLNFIEPGIHDNIELVDVKVDTSPTGSNFIAFTYEAQDGKRLTKTEWEPLGEDDQKLAKAKNQAKRIKHIMTKFMPEEATKIEVDLDNWTKYASTVKAKLDPFIKGIKLKLKAVYDNKNYVSTPNYVPFLEVMGTDPSTLSISSIDKMTREEPDEEVPVTNPFDTNSDPVANTENKGGTIAEDTSYKARNDNSDLNEIREAVAKENSGDLPF